MTTLTCFRPAILGAVASLVLGCGLLDTETPNIIQPGNVESPAGAQARRAGALADWAFVRDGDGTTFVDGEILLTGLMADEFVLSTTPPGEQEIDQRKISLLNVGIDSLFLLLHRARAEAEDAAAAIERFSPDPASEPGIPEMLTVAGFTYISFGEDFCSGVPFSRVSGDTLVYGDPETTAQIFDRAIARFDSALAHPGIAEDVANLATVGKARALLDQNQAAAAAALVAGVPTDFQYVTEHAESPLRLQNAVWVYTHSGLWSVSDAEGGNGLPYIAAVDPRVPVDSTDADGDGFADPGLDLSTPQYSLEKYADATASIVVANGVEARLIEAEAQLQNNDFAGMTASLNALRQGAPDLGLADLPNPGSRDEAIDQLFGERAFWLFATGHRLGDMRRLIRQYGRTADQVFPTGSYLKGGSYGSDVNFPIPRSENSNPKFNGCLDRNA